MPDYPDKLSATKASYPFERWARRSPERYNPAVRTAFTGIFDGLIDELAAAGENASEEQKLACFRRAVEALNKLDAENNHLIETVQREALCDLCWVVAKESGLDPAKYGNGEGPASIWRHW